jgi:hypothetical protein
MEENTKKPFSKEELIAEFANTGVDADYVYDYITDRAMQKAGYEGLNDPEMDDYALL